MLSTQKSTSSAGCCTPFFSRIKAAADVNQDGNIDGKDLALAIDQIQQYVVHLDETIASVTKHLELEASKSELFIQKMLMNVDKLILKLQAIEPFIKATDPQADQIVNAAIEFLKMLRPINSASLEIAQSELNITPPTDFASFSKTLNDSQLTSSTIEANLRMLKMAGVPGMTNAIEGFKKVDAVLDKAKEINQAMLDAEKKATLVTVFNATAAALATGTPAPAPAPSI